MLHAFLNAPNALKCSMLYFLLRRNYPLRKLYACSGNMPPWRVDGCGLCSPQGGFRPLRQSAHRILPTLANAVACLITSDVVPAHTFVVVLSQIQNLYNVYVGRVFKLIQISFSYYFLNFRDYFIKTLVRA